MINSDYSGMFNKCVYLTHFSGWDKMCGDTVVIGFSVTLEN